MTPRRPDPLRVRVRVRVVRSHGRDHVALLEAALRDPGVLRDVPEVDLAAADGRPVRAHVTAGRRAAGEGARP